MKEDIDRLIKILKSTFIIVLLILRPNILEVFDLRHTSIPWKRIIVQFLGEINFLGTSLQLGDACSPVNDDLHSFSMNRNPLPGSACHWSNGYECAFIVRLFNYFWDFVWMGGVRWKYQQQILLDSASALTLCQFNDFDNCGKPCFRLKPMTDCFILQAGLELRYEHYVPSEDGFSLHSIHDILFKKYKMDCEQFMLYMQSQPGKRSEKLWISSFAFEYKIFTDLIWNEQSL